MGCGNSRSVRIHPQERSGSQHTQSQPVSASTVTETVVTPVITEEQDKLTVEDLESSPPISPDEETKRETVELPLKGDETIVQDLENEAQPDSSPSQDHPLNEGEETAIKDDVMKVESIPSLEVTTVDRSAPNTLSEPAAPPGLDTTLVVSGSESCLPLQPALDNRGAGLLVSELKSQSASIVSTNDKTSLALRATHSQTDVDKTRGVEVDLKNVNQVSSKEATPAQQVENIGESTDTPQLEEEETASKTSLKKVESEPKIEDSPAAPTSVANDSTPSVSGESPPLQSPDQDSTHPPTQQTDKPSEGINIEEDNNTTIDPPPVKEPCNTTTDPPPVKEPCNTTTDPPPVKEPCNTTTDPPPVKEPCNTTTDPPPVKEPCDKTNESNKSMDDENPPPQNDNENTPQDNKEQQEEDGSNLETEPIPSNPSPTLSKRTEDSDSRKIDHNTGQSSAVELGNTETTPTSLVQEVPATV